MYVLLGVGEVRNKSQQFPSFSSKSALTVVIKLLYWIRINRSHEVRSGAFADSHLNGNRKTW